MVWLIPFRRERIGLSHDGSSATSDLVRLLHDKQRLAFLLGGAEHDRPVSVRVSNARFTVALQPRTLERLPYLPVVEGEIGGEAVQLTIRPPAYDVVFLLSWPLLLTWLGGPIWVAVGVPLIYHLAGCWVFSSNADRANEVLRASCRSDEGVQQGVEADKAEPE